MKPSKSQSLRNFCKLAKNRMPEALIPAVIGRFRSRINEMDRALMPFLVT
jgi:hypothetical protein